MRVSTCNSQIVSSTSEDVSRRIQFEDPDMFGPHLKPHLTFCDRVLSELNKYLALPWIAVTVEDGINVLLLSRDREQSVQRRAFFHFNGQVDISVHRKQITEPGLQSMLLGKLEPFQVAAGDPEWKVFVQRIICVVQRFKSYEVCVGVHETEYKPLWDFEKFGEVDKNPYGEMRYKKTFRPFACHLLVSTSKHLRRRCSSCIQTKIRLSAKIARHKLDILKPCTPNAHLDRTDLLRKVCVQQKKLKYNHTQISKLKAELQKATSQKGIFIDDSMSEELIKVCMDYVIFER